jgi:hypothetical protein
MERKITRKQLKILEYMAKNGLTWYYQLYHVAKIASNKSVLDALKNLKKMDFIEVKKKKEPKGNGVFGRKVRCYGLTFKGLLACLKYDVIKPANALDVEGKNQITQPFKAPPTCYGHEYGDLLDKPSYPHECQLLKKFKNEHPEIFYQIASSLFQEQTEDLNALCCATVNLGSAYLYLNDQKFYAKAVEEGDFRMGCLSMEVGFGVGDPVYVLRPSEMFLKTLGIKTKSVADLPDDDAEVVELLKKHGLFTDRMKEFCNQLSIEY